jgi:inhibitor of cysteine peptidase
VLASALGLPACAHVEMDGEPRENNVSTGFVLNRQDSGKSVAVHPGDTISISLPENPSTGYRWVLDPRDESVVAPVGSHFVHGAAGAPGEGGQRVWTFSAAQEGVARLSFTLRRAWEAEASAADSFEVTIISYR